MSDVTEADLLAAVFAEVDGMLAGQVRQPGEFTMSEYAAHAGMTCDRASHKLSELVRAGKLASRWAKVNGRRMYLYRVK